MRFLIVVTLFAMVALCAGKTVKEASIRCSYQGQDCGECCRNYIPGPGRECYEKISVWGQENKADRYAKCRCMCDAPSDINQFLNGFMTNGFSYSGKKK